MSDSTKVGDGRGMNPPKATSKEASVEGHAAKGVPGGESSGSNWIDMEGPNSAKGQKGHMTK